MAKAPVRSKKKTQTKAAGAAKAGQATAGPAKAGPGPNPKKSPRSNLAASLGGKLIIAANRLPVRRVTKGRKAGWETAPGGLVSALYPLLVDLGGAWVGWDGTTGRKARDPFLHDGIRVQPVNITADELDRFYAGFSNRTLWPLYHDAIREPAFHRHWWWPYLEVNQRYADAAADLAGQRDLIWVQDYHLQLVPGMLREKRPKARIGFFLHTPFPPEELFAKMPWRRQVLEGMLGADVIGFQDRLSALNFARTARRFTGATGPGRQAAV